MSQGKPNRAFLILCKLKPILAIIFWLCLYAVNAQDMNSIWTFGDSAGIDFTNVSNPVPITSSMDGRGSCASISNSSGNLKLYAGTLHYLNNDWSGRAFNSQNLIIPGCDSITGYDLYSELVLIPRPENVNQYYLFSIGNDSPVNSGCYYSLIDVSLNGGSGGMRKQNIQINSACSGDCLTAIKHGNGRDWWVINKLSDLTNMSHLNRFYVYLVTADSVYNPQIHDLFGATDADFQKIIVHPEGDKFMLINPGGFMSEFNFDRCSGTIALLRNIFPEQTANFNHYFWEGAYSPNGNLFYVTTSSPNLSDKNYLLQYDLTATNIALHCDTIDQFFNPELPGAVRLAPDNKIYITRYYNWGSPYYPYPDSVRNYINENLSVINYPDSIGSACSYNPFSFYLGGKRTYHGLPNNPNYSLGPVFGSTCDTIFNTTDAPIKDDTSILISPNPCSNYITVNFNNKKENSTNIRIYNSSGECVYYLNHFNAINGMKQINVTDFAKGLYLINVETSKGSYVKKFIKE
jgi:hypothetical protein